MDYSVKYKIKCLVCDSTFVLPDDSATVPKHPAKGAKVTHGMPYIPCSGSDCQGIFLAYYYPESNK